ncbi:EAL domain-containing protein [Phenylobacterium sp.]|uniref:EAL domain-containing protein n=1 Tax=Phenylobacterium sp. TaxID=1871053 RepID=UPI0035ADC6D6
MDRDQQSDDWRDRMSERAALAARAAGIGIWEWDVRSASHHWDAQMRQLFDLPAEAPVDLPEILRAVDPRDRRQVAADLEAAAGGAALDMKFRIRTPRGALRWIRTVGELSKASDTARLLGASWDVTSSQSLSVALQDEKERLEVTLAALGDAVVTTDADGVVRFLNGAAETLLALPADRAVGRPLDEVLDLRSTEGGGRLPNIARACVARGATRLTQKAWLTTPLGTIYEIESTVSSIVTRRGDIIGAVLVIQDVTDARRQERQLRHAATHDPLTGLANRTLLQEALKEAVIEAGASGSRHVLCYVDVDQFKMINDTAGHEAGDHYLCQVSGIIRSQIGGSDLLARIGGDEFALLLRKTDIEAAQGTAQRIIQAATDFRFTWKDDVFRTGLSMGLCAVDGAFGPGELLSQADLACYEAKTAGRGRAAVFAPEDTAMAERRREMAVVAGMRDVLSENRLVLFAQPIVAARAADGGHRYELLVRMIDTGGRLVAPGAFIPAAERFDLMSEIDRWVVEEAVGRLGPRIAEIENLQISINLSAGSLNSPAMLIQLVELLQTSPVLSSAITFEITESAALNNLATTGDVMERLRALGCKVALDDFGSGVSSFAYLKHFGVDSVKIDGSFIRNITRDETDRAIVESMNALAHRLGATTVAEFVEDADTLTAVTAIGVDYLQGYAFGRPRPFESVLEALAPKPPHPNRAA